MGEGGRRLEARRPRVGEARGEAQARLEKARGFESWAGWRPVRAGFEAARLGKAEGSREGVPGGVSRRPAAPIMVCGGASRAAGRAARAMVREGNAAQCAAGAAKPCAHLASTLVRNGHRRLDGAASRLPACGAAHKGTVRGLRGRRAHKEAGCKARTKARQSGKGSNTSALSLLGRSVDQTALLTTDESTRTPQEKSAF